MTEAGVFADSKRVSVVPDMAAKACDRPALRASAGLMAPASAQLTVGPNK
jgi:hypothetical protein